MSKIFLLQHVHNMKKTRNEIFYVLFFKILILEILCVIHNHGTSHLLSGSYFSSAHLCVWLPGGYHIGQELLTQFFGLSKPDLQKAATNK